jgi:hypothetical protein
MMVIWIVIIILFLGISWFVFIKDDGEVAEQIGILFGGYQRHGPPPTAGLGVTGTFAVPSSAFTRAGDIKNRFIGPVRQPQSVTLTPFFTGGTAILSMVTEQYQTWFTPRTMPTVTPVPGTLTLTSGFPITFTIQRDRNTGGDTGGEVISILTFTLTVTSPGGDKNATTSESFAIYWN